MSSMRNETSCFILSVISNSVLKNVIYQAASENKITKLNELMRLGYPIDARDGEGMTALCTAVENGDDDAYELLLKYGANQNSNCMEVAEHNKSAKRLAKIKKYGGMELIGVAGVGVAAALGGGGGGGGGSS